jgi:hypothetical protein
MFQNVAIGTTPLRFARWLGTENTRADEVTVRRDGNVYSTRLILISFKPERPEFS